MNSTNADEYQRLKIESFRCILCNIFDVGIGSIFSNNGFRMANCFCCLSQNAMVCLDHCRQELQQKSRKTARLFLQDQDQMFKTKTKTSFLSSSRLETNTMVSWTTSLHDKTVFHDTKYARPRPRPQCTHQTNFWCQTGLVLRSTVSDHITGIDYMHVQN